MAKKKEALLDLPVSFGNVSIGDKTARVGVSLGRELSTVTAADKNFCGRRLTGRLVGKENDAHGDQGNLDGFSDIELTGCFDIKGLSVSKKTIGFGLTFSLDGLDLATVGHFAKRLGRLQVYGIEDIPEGEMNDDDEE